MLGSAKITQRMKRRSAIASGWLEKHKSDLAETSPSEPGMKSDSFAENPSKSQNLTPVKDTCRSSLPDWSDEINSKNEKMLNKPLTTNKNFEEFLPTQITANNVRESEVDSRSLEKSVSPPSRNINCSGKNSFTKTTTGGIGNSTTSKGNGLIDGKSNRLQCSNVPSLDNSTPVSMFGNDETESGLRSTDVDSVDETSLQEKLPDVSATKRKRSGPDGAHKTTDEAEEPFEDVGKKPAKIRRTNCNESGAETLKEEETPKERTQKRWVWPIQLVGTECGLISRVSQICVSRKWRIYRRFS